MFLFLSKTLPVLLYPPAFTLWTVLLAVFLRRRGPRLARALLAIGLGSLYLLSNRLVSRNLISALEAQNPPLALESIPQADAIVVLGGYLRPPAGARPLDLKDSIDRLWTGARLYRAGKAPLILLTGGNVIYDDPIPVSEASAARDVLIDWGIPSQAILIEEKSQNTRENAVFTAPIVESHHAKRLLLVTSAFHMPRAAAIFRRAGLQFTPVAADYRSGGAPGPLLFRLIPEAENLLESRDALREWIGLTVYRLRGWA